MAGTRVGGPDFNYRAPRSVLTRVERSGPKPAYTNEPVCYKFFIDGGSVTEIKTGKSSPKGTRAPPSGGPILRDVEKVRVFLFFF